MGRSIQEVKLPGFDVGSTQFRGNSFPSSARIGLLPTALFAGRDGILRDVPRFPRNMKTHFLSGLAKRRTTFARHSNGSPKKL